jgi:hypothetical protein
MILRSLLAVMGLVLVSAVMAQTTARLTTDIPIAEFFKRPAVASPMLSPDGQRIATLVPGPTVRMILAVADVATPNKRVGIAQFEDADVRNVQWVNDTRLLFDAIDFQAPLGEQFGGCLYVRDFDGGNFVLLVGRGRGFESQGHAAIRPLR